MKLSLASRIVACVGAYSFVSALYTWFTRGAVAWFEILFGALCATVIVYFSVRPHRGHTPGNEKMPTSWLAATFVIAVGLTLGLNLIRSGSVEAFNVGGIAQAIVVGLITVTFCARQDM